MKSYSKENAQDPQALIDAQINLFSSQNWG